MDMKNMKELMEKAKNQKITISLDDYLEAVAEIMADMEDEGAPLAVILTVPIITGRLKDKLFKPEPCKEELEQGYKEAE